MWSIFFNHQYFCNHQYSHDFKFYWIAASWPLAQMSCHKNLWDRKKSINKVYFPTLFLGKFIPKTHFFKTKHNFLCVWNAFGMHLECVWIFAAISMEFLWFLFKFFSSRLLFGGSMPHYFYKLMEKTLTGRTKLNQILFFACERLMYTPMFQALSLFFLAIFEVSLLDFHLPKIFLIKSMFLGQKPTRSTPKLAGTLLACSQSQLDVFIVACVC